MVISEMTLWIARMGVLGLMYLFLLALVLALLADARAASKAPAKEAPAPGTPAPATGVSQLRVVAGTTPHTGDAYALVGPLEIGRKGECSIVIANSFVSSHHARIYPADGQWVVEDLGSTNGTLINGNALLSAHVLKQGDRVIVGDTEFEVS